MNIDAWVNDVVRENIEVVKHVGPRENTFVLRVRIHGAWVTVATLTEAEMATKYGRTR